MFSATTFHSPYYYNEQKLLSGCVVCFYLMHVFAAGSVYLRLEVYKITCVDNGLLKDLVAALGDRGSW